MRRQWQIRDGLDCFDLVLRCDLSPLDERPRLSPRCASQRAAAWFSRRNGDGLSRCRTLEELCRVLTPCEPCPTEAELAVERVARALARGVLIALPLPRRTCGWPAKVDVRLPVPIPVPPVRTDETAPNRESVCLWVRLELDPEEASHHGDRFVLTSGDGSYRQVKTVRDDRVPGDGVCDLVYTSLYEDQSYTLEVVSPAGSHVLFERVPYAHVRTLREQSQPVADEPAAPGAPYPDEEPL